MIRSVAVLAAMGLISCSLDYGKTDFKPEEEIPLMTFHQLKQTGVKNGKIQYTMTATQSDVFNTSKQTQLSHFEFQEYDSNGKPASSGSAENAVINTVTNDARLTGKLEARDSDRGIVLSIDAGPMGGLSWSNDNRLLTSTSGADVLVTKDDGSSIRARGLTLDLWSNRLNLENGVDGRWTPEETHENSAPAPGASDQSPPSGG